MSLKLRHEKENNMKLKQFIVALVVGVFSLAALTGCGGGGGDTVPTTVSGVAATGAPIANATVTLMDSRGNIATSSTDANGNYSLNVANHFYPFAIKVDWNDGSAHTLYSFARIPGNTANINPMTNAAVLNASGASDLTSFADSYFNSADRSALTQVAVNVNLALSNIQTKLDALLTRFAATSTNPFSVNYTIGTLGLDKLFDLVAFDISGGTVTIRNRIDNSVICSGAVNNAAAWSVNSANIPNALGTISITGISPASGTVGDHIIIAGTGFIANPTLNSVKIGSITATVFAATSTTLEIVIPAGAVTGPVSVKNVNGIAQSGSNLSVH